MMVKFASVGRNFREDDRRNPRRIFYNTDDDGHRLIDPYTVGSLDDVVDNPCSKRYLITVAATGGVKWVFESAWFGPHIVLSIRFSPPFKQ
jgi:hypothetical protein